MEKQSRPCHSTLAFYRNQTIFVFKGFFLLMYVIQHCCICRPSIFNASEDARIKPRTFVTVALTARRSNHSASFFHLLFGILRESPDS